jgi:broad specificity phosphatase PhoE
MNEKLCKFYLARHDETAPSLTGQHTGRADLALTKRDECNARNLRQRLSGLTFAKVFTSPRFAACGRVSWPASELDVLFFSSRHFLRFLAVRWIGELVAIGRYFPLNTATLSALSYAHNPSQLMIQSWNDDHHHCLPMR